jgi:hypothetical protein
LIGRTREAVGVLGLPLEGTGYTVLSLLVSIKNQEELVEGFGIEWLDTDEVVKILDRRDDFKS